MGFISWIIFGALAGWISSILVDRNDEQGAIGNIFVGILGAVLGGWIANFIGFQGVTGFNLVSLVIAIGGAVILLSFYKALTKRA